MRKLISIFLFLFSIGCSEGFQTVGPNSEAQDKQSQSEFTAFIQSGPFEGTQVLNNIENSKLNVIVPAGINNFLVTSGFSDPSGQVTGNVSADSLGYKTVRFSIPFSWISRGVSLPSIMTLPNGESLTQFPNQTASYLRIPLNVEGTTSLHLYFSPPNFGAFVQTPFEYPSSSPYSVTYGRTFLDIGLFSTHPSRTSNKGGLLLFISLPE